MTLAMTDKDKMDFIELTETNLNMPIPAPEIAHIDKLDLNVELREVYVYGNIDEDFGAWFTCIMAYLESLSEEPITIRLNTPGGDEVSMFSFHDSVRTSPCHVTIIATGQVCSAGVLMLACGDMRLVTESCVLMSHRGKGGMEGDYETILARTKYVKWSEQHWSVLMDRYTPEEVDGQKRDVSYWFNLGKKQPEWWVLGGFAIVHEGIADAVVGDPKRGGVDAE
jgi:ATP-dependent Clp protease protease subunit